MDYDENDLKGLECYAGLGLSSIALPTELTTQHD
ncbi:terminase [Xenorhabdus vietnamensis]|uniref:Terminase n=1 Tax=Xenorhabdus vietnamensis TaxID=351656 RepID=A0A1Y2SGZ6_9GAMM|nr:terminase [Xenorhabdus vietnamensis]